MIKTTWAFTPPHLVAPKRRGFAALSAEERARISSAGGKAVHRGENANVFTSETARIAATKSSRNKRKTK